MGCVRGMGRHVVAMGGACWSMVSVDVRLRWVDEWLADWRCVCLELSVRCVVGSLGPERVWAECTHRVGRAHAKKTVVKA